MSEGNLHDILKNSYILARLSDEQIISIILIIKKLRDLDMIQKSEGLYIATGKKATSHKVVAGKELNEANIKFPERYLLLQDLGDDKSLVADFGDFHLYNVDKLLYYFKINESYLEGYAESIFQMIIEVSNWLDLTGREFVIDTKMFRPKSKASSEIQHDE